MNRRTPGLLWRIPKHYVKLKHEHNEIHYLSSPNPLHSTKQSGAPDCVCQLSLSFRLASRLSLWCSSTKEQAWHSNQNPISWPKTPHDHPITSLSLAFMETYFDFSLLECKPCPESPTPTGSLKSYLKSLSLYPQSVAERFFNPHRQSRPKMLP